jgi:ABC-type uncharacterized transport system permease subunit
MTSLKALPDTVSKKIAITVAAVCFFLSAIIVIMSHQAGTRIDAVGQMPATAHHCHV